MKLFSNSSEFELCGVHWLQHLVREHHGRPDVSFTQYGSGGQAQYGIDLVPLHDDVGIVAQCKLRDGILSLNEIEADLEKSNRYPGRIDHFYVLTTGKRDKTVQNRLLQGYIRARPNGSSFQVHVKYLDDHPRLEFLTPSALSNLVNRIPIISRFLEERGAADPSEVLKSQRAFRSYMMKHLPPEAIDNLERCAWYSGRICASILDPIDDIHFEYDRAKHVLAGNSDFAHQGDRAELVAGISYGKRLLDAVSSFREAYINWVRSDTIGGVTVLIADDNPGLLQLFSKVGSNERKEVIRLYRTLVQGLPVA